MSHTFRQVDRETLFLLPPSMEDWLPEGHLARFVVEIVGQLDLTTIKTAYAGRGSKAHHPEMLLALLFYGYATGVFSSRKLERATYDSVAFRYIAANDHPDHDTIATFRKRFLPELTPLFVQILLIAQQMGILKLGKVSLDGTKIKANASKHRALSWKHACKLEAQLKAEVEDLLRRDVKSAWPPLPEPRPKSNSGLPSAMPRSKPATRRSSPSVRPKSKRAARNPVASNPSHPCPAPGTRTRSTSPTQNPGSCPSPETASISATTRRPASMSKPC
jgi:transposase